MSVQLIATSVAGFKARTLVATSEKKCDRRWHYEVAWAHVPQPAQPGAHVQKPRSQLPRPLQPEMQSDEGARSHAAPSYPLAQWHRSPRQTPLPLHPSGHPRPSLPPGTAIGGPTSQPPAR